MAGVPDRLVHVPTLRELYEEKPPQAIVLERNKKNEPTHFRAKPEGQQRIDDAMRHNGEYLRTHPDVSRKLMKETFDNLRANV